MSMIAVEGMEFYAYHGCTEEEKKVGIHFQVDVLIDCNIDLPSETDNINDALNYQTVYQIVARQMLQTSNLLEHLGRRIKNELESTFPQAKNIRVTVSKMNPPLGGKVKRVSITI
jgi:7,8-dihydroneopterin aldolase/epimerase/oxygenase